jgi:electron transfer flavoprotein beta subunit
MVGRAYLPCTGLLTPIVRISDPTTVTAGATEPRYPTLKGIMGAKKKPLDTLSLADLGLGPADVAPTQRVTNVEPAPQKAAGEVVPATDGVARIVDLLADAKVL